MVIQLFNDNCSCNLTYSFPVIRQDMSTFTLEQAEDGGVKMETGKGKCPFEPSQHYTAVMAGGALFYLILKKKL